MRRDFVSRGADVTYEVRVTLRDPAENEERRPDIPTIENLEQAVRGVDDARGKMGPVVLAQLSPDTTDVKPLLDIDGEGVVQVQEPPASLLPRCCSIADTIVFTDCRICFPWFSSAITTP